MTNVEKALRSLSLGELEKLINLCCTEGKRSQTYLEDRLYRDVTWTHTIMGVPLKFFYYKGLHSDFRISGDGWMISFKGTKLADPGVKQYHSMHIGPLSRERTGLRVPASAESFYVHTFRRRGNLDKFRYHLSLLRLML